jgi:hypothetical protein
LVILLFSASGFLSKRLANDKSLSENVGGMPGNSGTGEMDECQSIVGLLLPADEQPAKAIHPGMGAFYRLSRVA